MVSQSEQREGDILLTKGLINICISRTTTNIFVELALAKNQFKQRDGGLSL